MAESRARFVLGWLGPSRLAAARSLGPLGWLDAADPVWSICPLGNTPGLLGVSDAAALMAKLGPAAVPQSSGNGPLEVGAGLVTFDAEGNDDPISIYFSRKVSWPGNSLSGVTLDRGYDKGDCSRTEVEADLEASGLDAAKAKSFGEGAGVKGVDAKKFIGNNRVKLGEISHAVQKPLFLAIDPGYMQRASKIYKKWTAGEANRVAWLALDCAIPDVLVDELVYQGSTKGGRAMKKGMRNDPKEFREYIESTPALSKYENGRRRAEYLRACMPKLQGQCMRRRLNPFEVPTSQRACLDMYGQKAGAKSRRDRADLRFGVRIRAGCAYRACRPSAGDAAVTAVAHRT